MPNATVRASAAALPIPLSAAYVRGFLKLVTLRRAIERTMREMEQLDDLAASDHVRARAAGAAVDGHQRREA